MKKKSKGFTLVELLAVIVILALIMILVIPSVLEVTNTAKKELFYDYSRTVQSKAVAKYIEDMDDESIKSNCRVYDIGKDLDIENTGNFEGWAKVNRKIVADEEKKVARIKLPTVSEVLRVMYCIGDGEQCTPDSQYKFPDGATQVTVEKTINKDQALCAYAEYPENGIKKTTSTMCQTFASADVAANGYAYDVIITIKDRDRAVNSFNFSESTTKEEFYSAIDKFKEEAKKENG